MFLADKIISFLKNLQFTVELPPGVEVMHPFTDAETLRVVDTFYHKYYNDAKERYCIIGINPGRFGGGVTGVPFTDPIRLKDVCGIENNWQRKQELSSLFVYDVVNAFGGPEAFYSKLYITAVSPLGFTKGNKNLNYYDDKLLLERIKAFATGCFKEQLSWGLNRDVAFCLGEGTNYKYLLKLNDEAKLFGKIVPLSHPRFIMQYRLKKKDEYVNNYLEAFDSHLR